MLRDVPDEVMPELFDVRKCHRVKHALPSPMQSSSDILVFLGSIKTLNSTDHHTKHFLMMGGANCCMTFQIHEFLFFFLVGGSAIVTVARLLSFCRRAPGRRASHSEMVASPCPPLPAQGAGESLLCLMFVTLSAAYATQNHFVSNL